jgi:hypothetical protein
MNKTINFQECPCCGKKKYQFWSGFSILDGKIEPDEGACYGCGFTYSEHCKYPIEEQIKDYKKLQKESI